MRFMLFNAEPDRPQTGTDMRKDRRRGQAMRTSTGEARGLIAGHSRRSEKESESATAGRALFGGSSGGGAEAAGTARINWAEAQQQGVPNSADVVGRSSMSRGACTSS